MPEKSDTTARELLRGVGGIPTPANLRQSPVTDDRPPIPPELFDELYAIPHPWDSNPVEILGCSKGVAFDTLEADADSVMLLPGEEQYLRKRLQSYGVPWRWREQLQRDTLLRIGEKCPYCEYAEDTECPAISHMPVMRRCYPLRVHRLGKYSLSVFLYTRTPFGKDATDIRAISDHAVAQRWVGAWKALLPFLPNRWWHQLRASCPAGYLHLADILDPFDLDTAGLPAYFLADRADPNCPACGGSGHLEGDRCRRCFPDSRVAELLHELQRRNNVFYATHPT